MWVGINIWHPPKSNKIKTKTKQKKDTLVLRLLHAGESVYFQLWRGTSLGLDKATQNDLSHSPPDSANCFPGARFYAPGLHRLWVPGPSAIRSHSKETWSCAQWRETQLLSTWWTQRHVCKPQGSEKLSTHSWGVPSPHNHVVDTSPGKESHQQQLTPFLPQLHHGPSWVSPEGAMQCHSRRKNARNPAFHSRHPRTSGTSSGTSFGWRMPSSPCPCGVLRSQGMNSEPFQAPRIDKGWGWLCVPGFAEHPEPSLSYWSARPLSHSVRSLESRRQADQHLHLLETTDHLSKLCQMRRCSSVLPTLIPVWSNSGLGWSAAAAADPCQAWRRRSSPLQLSMWPRRQMSTNLRQVQGAPP